MRVYLLWLVTEWDLLRVAGILTIWGGLACVAIGFTCAALYAVKLRRAGALWAIAGRIATPVGLMLLNIPVCIVIFSLAWAAVTRYELTLSNESDTVVSRFEMTAPGVEETFENVKPGESRSVGVHFERDGSFAYTAEVNGRRSSGLIKGYVTHSMGGEMNVTYARGEFQFERTWE